MKSQPKSFLSRACRESKRSVAVRRFNILLLLVASASAFTHTYMPPGRSRSMQPSVAYGCQARHFGIHSLKTSLHLSNNSENSMNTNEEVEEMEELIVSLSLEPTDESRRERVATIFAEELANPNGAPKKFSDLFASTLNVVGDRVQQLASEKVAEKQKEEAESDNQTGGEKKEQMETVVSIPEGRQLWALVDMMVQSKTIVQSHTGKLGSKGKFQ